MIKLTGCFIGRLFEASSSARVKIYHDVNGSWLYPTYAALLGVPPIVFKRSSSGMTSLFARLSKRTATDNNTK